MSQQQVEEPSRELTPPIIQPPTAKEKKYDRQLRLWAASGQRKLEESHVLLIVGEEENEGSHSFVAGVETLKNLILPGIGGFTIADAAKVTDADLGINFFLDDGSLNKSRAEQTTRLLQELNPDVKGDCIAKEPPSKWLPREDSLKPYALVIVCAPVSQEVLSRVCSSASELSIPVIYVRSTGFYSAFSIQLPTEFPVVDTHPDPDTMLDIRLLAPWPELSAEVDSLGDLPSMSEIDHGHIPYIFILLHTLKVWRATHDDKYPSTFKEKTEFRDLVRSAARTNNPEGGEENFDEACAAVLKAVAPPPIGSGCKEMFDMPSCTNLTAESAKFWLIANAIKTFYENHSLLPLPGSVPDMKATSEGYLKLQNIYKAKARKDVAEVTASVRELEKSLGKTTPIEQIEIEAFCKNASHVRVLTNSNNKPIPTLRIMQNNPKTLSAIKSTLENDWQDLFPIFLALEAPYLNPAELTSDEGKQETLRKCIEEVGRAQGGELHNISSVTGGMVAQEAIKLLTKQYVPVDGVCVFDGVGSRVGVFKV
jgi:NEDD8-activating enzyme E1 regulatory subunit